MPTCFPERVAKPHGRNNWPSRASEPLMAQGLELQLLPWRKGFSNSQYVEMSLSYGAPRPREYQEIKVRALYREVHRRVNCGVSFKQVNQTLQNLTPFNSKRIGIPSSNSSVNLTPAESPPHTHTQSVISLPHAHAHLEQASPFRCHATNMYAVCHDGPKGPHNDHTCSSDVSLLHPAKHPGSAADIQAVLQTSRPPQHHKQFA
jgi:hypothetical protein